jgi:hypothetical protein
MTKQRKRSSLDQEMSQRRKFESIIMKGLLLQKYKVEPGVNVIRFDTEHRVASITITNDVVIQQNEGKKTPVTFHSLVFGGRRGMEIIDEYASSTEWLDYRKSSEFREKITELRQHYAEKNAGKGNASD